MILRQLLRTIIAVSENKCHEVTFLVTQHPEEQSFLFPVLWGRFQAELPAGSLRESSNSHVTVTWRQTEHQNQLVHSREDSKRSILRWVNLTSNQMLLKLGQNQSFLQKRCRKTPPKKECQSHVQPTSFPSCDLLRRGKLRLWIGSTWEWGLPKTSRNSRSSLIALVVKK